jgi:hypothetical protein
VRPWFQDRPGLAVSVAAGLYVAVLGLRWLVSEPQPITLLLWFPIALLAIAFGLRVGLLAGAAGILTVAIWVAVGGVELSFWGWVTRAAPMLLLGGLLGDAADRLRASEKERTRLQATARRQQDAAELQDRIVQELAAAKWAFEGGRTERGLEILTGTLDAAQRLVSQMLRDAYADSEDLADP